jgi:phosphoglycerate-specific signal transduction histidine kinase
MDFKQVSYCVRSIILHALDACPDPGELRIASRYFDQSVFVEILDRRHTLPTELMEGLLRLPPFNGTEELGKEIGLRLCRIIMERHASDFQMLGLPEGGTLYTMRFPEERRGSDEADTGGG